MNIAERIQYLRKTKGLSQEELADKVGVSRQAVSKWESEQSVPDIDKIIILSEYFEVTTDYIIKGIEPTPKHEKDMPDARIFLLAGTVFNFMGLVVSLIVWFEEQSAVSVMIGLILMMMGTMIFFVGQYIGKNIEEAKNKFWVLNIWALVLIPYSLIFNFAQSRIFGHYMDIRPILDLGNSFVFYALGWVIYVLVCVIILKKLKINNGRVI